MCLRCCGCIPASFRPVALLCGDVGRRRAHTARWYWLCVCVCVLVVHSLAVWVQTGVGHVHTVAMSGPGAQQVSLVSRPPWAQWFCDYVCVCVGIAVVGPTMVTPEDRGGLGMRVRVGGIPW